MPRVSIGLPVCNGERYLAASIDSLLAQTLTDLEIIVCDNASTDGTGDISRAFARRDPRVRYVRNPANIGANRNYNLAMQLARGTYFKLGADDDLLEPTYVERTVALLDDDPGLSIAHSAIRYIDDFGAPLGYDPVQNRYLDATGQTSIEPPDPNYALDDDPVQRFHIVLRRSTTSHFALGLMRTKVLRRTGGFGLYYSADRAFLAEMALYGKFAAVPEVLFHKREHRHNSRSLSPDQRIRWTGQTLASSRAEYLHLLRIIWRAPLGSWDRTRCLAVGVGKVADRAAQSALTLLQPSSVTEGLVTRAR
jgi:glycosyltransferase involved in cell wall biosynthesis